MFCIQWVGMHLVLPAENAAMTEKKHPEEWTYKNIKTMKDQLFKWVYL